MMRSLQTGTFTRLVLPAALVATLVVSGCNRGSDDKTKAASAALAPVVVALHPASVRPVERSIGVVGTLYGSEEATISSKVVGQIVSTLKDVGDIVGPDEPLAIIDPVDYQLAVKQREMALNTSLSKLGLTQVPDATFDVTQVPSVKRAKLEADNALARYNRGLQLHDQKPPLLSDQDFADIKTAYEVAASNYDVELLATRVLVIDARAKQTDLDVARQKLADATVRSPLAQGTTQPAARTPRYAVTARMVSVGEYVKDAVALYRVVDDTVVKFRANVPERYLSRIAVGQTVRLSVEAWPDTFEGRIARINPQVDLANRTFQIEALVPNDKQKLKAGSFARGEVMVGQEQHVVFVPIESVVSFAGTNTVYTVRDDKDKHAVAAAVNVEMGNREGNLIEITKGLKGDESVVVSGNSKLADGVKVTVKSEKEILGNATTVPGATSRESR
jgi:RND family efflux transporter MFP subunit